MTKQNADNANQADNLPSFAIPSFQSSICGFMAYLRYYGCQYFLKYIRPFPFER